MGFEGPQGEMGPAGPTGQQGPIGPTGPPSAGAVIPFSVGNTTVTLDSKASGQASSVLLTSFGSHSATAYALNDGWFTLPAGDGGQHPFSMPYTATVKGIYATFVNKTSISAPAGARIYPYIILATAPPTGDTFTIIAATETAAGTPWLGGSTIPAGAALSGFASETGAVIPAGFRVAICCAFRITGEPSAESFSFYYSGGLLLA